MNKVFTFISLVFITTFFACNTSKTNYKQQIDNEIQEGNFTIAKQMIDSVIETLSSDEKAEFEFVKDSLHRVELDFLRTKEEIVDWIETNRGFTPSDSLLNEWEKSNVLEYRIIDGEKRYFRNARLTFSEWMHRQGNYPIFLHQNPIPHVTRC